MDTRTIFFVGKPGCGKGTQAKLLSEKTGWPVFSSGKLFRALAAEDTPVGKKVKFENDAGLLQPHWFAMYFYLKSLFSLSEGASAIFDGFNRKIQETELIMSSTQWLERPFTVVHIAVSDEAVRERLGKRREIEGRADDNVVEERLREYEMHTVPAMEVFTKAGVMIDVNGEQPPEKIAEDIRAALGLPVGEAGTA